MKNAPWIGPAISTPSSVVRVIHLSTMPSNRAAQLNASAIASPRKMRIIVAVEGSFMRIS